MNKISIYLTCLLFLSNQLRAQVIYERTYPDEFPSMELPIELSDTFTFSMAPIENNDCLKVGIRHIDALGNEDEINPFYAEAFSSGYHWIGHDSVLIWYEDGSWDVGPDSFRISIWTPESITNVHTTSAHYGIPFRKYGAFLYTPEQLIIEKTDTLFLKNLITSVIEDSLYFFSGIKSILEFKDGILVISKSGSASVIDRNLNRIYDWHIIANFPFDTAKAVILDSFLIGKDESNSTLLQSINVFNESIRQLDLSTYLSEIEDVQSNKGFLFVKGVSISGLIVLQFDTRFQLLQVSSLDIPGINGIKTLRYYPDRVYAWGSNGLGAYRANYRICYSYQDPEPMRLVDIKLDSMWIHSIQIVTPTNPTYAYLGISCRIINLSSDTIHSATLHYDENEPQSTCFTGVQAIHFDDLNILPGETDTVQFQSYSVDLVHGGKLNRQYFLEHGNHQLDGDTSNNIFNLIYTITAIEDLQRDTIGIYPNPFSDALNTTYVSGGIQMVLYDQVGRAVSKGQDQLINLGGLPAGIYFLQIQSGNSIATRRVVKVE